MRPEVFRRLLLDGIDHGCLEPECHHAWEWLKVAAFNNDLSEFKDDLNRYYDIFAEAGNENARYIMNRIWKPKQIIEED